MIQLCGIALQPPIAVLEDEAWSSGLDPVHKCPVDRLRAERKSHGIAQDSATTAGGKFRIFH